MPDAAHSPLMAQHARLRTLARVLTVEDAEDHVQDTYVAALSRPEPPHSPGAWMRQVLRNGIREHARRRRRHRELDNLVQPPAPLELPEEAMADEEVARLLREVLTKVGEPYAQVIEMRFFEELSASEIGRVLDVPAGTVRWRLHEGLGRMRSELDARDEGQREWAGMLLAFASPPIPLEPAVGATKLAAVGGLTALAASTLVLAITSANGCALTTDDPISTSERASPAVQPSPDRPAAVASRPIDPANVVSATSRGAPNRDLGGPSETVGEAPLSHKAEAQACAMEAIEAYNQSPDAPEEEAAAYLVEAANCSEDAHMIGQGIHVNRFLLERYPDSAYAVEAKAGLRRLFSRIVDAEAGLDTIWGGECVAPLDDDDSVEERLTAAQCLDDAALYGSALQLRKQLAEDMPRGQVEANAEAISKLEEEILEYEEMGAEYLPAPGEGDETNTD